MGRVTKTASRLLPMASPPRPISVALESDDLVVASLKVRLDRSEQLETATQYRFGITQTRFRADVDRKASGVTGPDVVRFHEAGDLIRSRVDDTLQSTWVVLSSAFVEDVAADTPAWRTPFSRPFTRPPLPVLAELHRFLRAASACTDALWAQEELTVLLPKLLTAGGETPSVRSRRGINKLAQSADELLGAEFAEIGSLAELARRLDVSGSYLTRAYRAATGGTLHARVTRLRLSHALARLAEGAKDITALALELGYASHSHFSAEFKRYIGQSPSAFRLSTQM